MSNGGSMTASTSFSDISGATTLSRSLAGSKALWSLSPLSDRDKLKATANLDALATDLANTGFYDVGWDDSTGRLQICHSPSSAVSLYESNSASINAFMNPKLSSSRRLLRPKTQSSLTFSTKAKNSDVSRPATARSVDLGEVGAMQRPGSSRGSTRFSRLAQSVESINALKGGSAGVAHSNVKALNEPNFVRYSSHVGIADARPGTPSQRPATETSGRPETPSGTGAARPGTPSARPATAPGPPSGEPGSRPGTAGVVDLNGTANRGFNGREMTSRLRPVTVRVDSMRATRSHPMSTFRPSRSQSFIVFSHMDKELNGKITRAQLEGFCLSVGLNLDQCNSFYSRLDKADKGYISVNDWGKADVAKAIEQFSLLYLQKFMGLPDITYNDEQVKKYWHNQSLKQAKSLTAAINLVRVNTVTKASHASMSSGNIVHDAFSFMDGDNSGELSKDEVKDGFYALGVQITDQIADQLFELFDKDKSGTVQYHEFLGVLFPNRQ